MSATPPAPAYSEAEKGTFETPRQLEVAYPKDEKKGLYPDEKKGDVAAFAVAELKKDTPAAVNRPKPAPKPKKKVSKWILWQLWFNTYRLVTLCLALIELELNRIQETLYDYVLPQYDRPWPRSVGSLAICH